MFYYLAESADVPERERIRPIANSTLTLTKQSHNAVYTLETTSPLCRHWSDILEWVEGKGLSFLASPLVIG